MHGQQNIKKKKFCSNKRLHTIWHENLGWA